MAREKFPGQKASLDALCSRLDVDRSKRVLHGALIDCELLAEVYLAMTREQFDLVGVEETAAAAQSADTGIAVQTAGGGLKILRADTEETAAHLEYLAELDKASGGQCLWTAEKTEQA